VYKKRDFYAPFGEVMVRTYRCWEENMDYPVKLKLCRGWDNPELYDEAIQWMCDTRLAIPSPGGGLSYIDNKRYFDVLQFKTKEDRLVFILQFGAICDRTHYA
jgi:hypothetical protein